VSGPRAGSTAAGLGLHLRVKHLPSCRNESQRQRSRREKVTGISAAHVPNSVSAALSESSSANSSGSFAERLIASPGLADHQHNRPTHTQSGTRRAARMMRLSLTLVFLSLAIGGVRAQSLSDRLGAQNLSDSHFFSDISSTTSPFALKGGNYQVCVVVTPHSGSVKLESLRPDNATYLPVNSKTNFTADGCATVNLPPGQYEFVLTGATGVYASISSIPQLQ
jgi:hypothetical protein